MINIYYCLECWHKDSATVSRKQKPFLTHECKVCKVKTRFILYNHKLRRKLNPKDEVKPKT